MVRRRSLVGFMLLFGCLAPRLVAAQVTIVPDTSRVIYVTGRASSVADPDIATISLGVWVADADAKRAKSSADSTISKIVSLATGLGVRDTDLKAASVNIEPRYDSDNPTRLRGYEVTRSVTIVLRNLASLDGLLDGAVQAGANRDFDIRLASSKAEDLKREAVTRALADAKAQASAAAESLGVRVGGVRSINLSGDAGRASSGSAATVAQYSAAKFLPGMIRIDVEIAVIFMIEDRR